MFKRKKIENEDVSLPSNEPSLLLMRLLVQKILRGAMSTYLLLNITRSLHSWMANIFTSRMMYLNLIEASEDERKEIKKMEFFVKPVRIKSLEKKSQHHKNPRGYQ